MIHIATVHHGNADWVQVQREYLDRNMTDPFRLWMSLEGVPESYHRFADEVVPSFGKHAGKLNHLATVIGEVADPDDVIVFLDGDAFPIADPMPLVERALSATPLVAVRRDENVGDPHPHPCFCATTVGFWRSLPGDWSNGAPWTNGAGEEISDVGGNLRWLLQHRGHEWTPILRSNVVDLHPVWFAVYGDVVYHHGAGFRRMITRRDWVDLGLRRNQRGSGLRRLAGELKIDRREEASRRLAREVDAQLRSDPSFYRRFLEPPSP